MDTVDKKAWDWLNQNQLSYNIWNKKYRDNNESFDEWLDRVSAGNPKIKELIFKKKFIFGGRTLANRGLKKGSYSNCYSIGFVPDSLEGILDVNTKIAMTFKAQGGQGLSLSKIRPKGSLIKGQFKSDGIVPFMEMFNTTTNSISQGGSRKGALLMSLDINHPEAETFMTIKSDHNKITKANLSVEIDDAFMHKVLEGDKEAIRLFDILCKQACYNAEPGIIFSDRLRNYNLMEYVTEYQIETTNPCGEQPLPKHGSCNLSSINLSEYVLNPFTDKASVDYTSLAEDLNYIVEAMDDVLQENLDNHILPEQRALAERFRNVGIGVMGLHDMFIKLGIIYGSPISKSIVSYLSNYLFRHAIWSSVSLAERRGVFPGYSSNIWDSNIVYDNFSSYELDKLKEINKLRNCSLLSVAPTGSIGTMFNVSTGVEPFFALQYTRRTVSLDGKETFYNVDVPVIEEAKKYNWHPECYISSKDINPKDRIEIQGLLQSSVDTAISSTINLPKSTTPEDVKTIFIEAWAKGLKGVTIYVDGCRDSILSTSTTQSSEHLIMRDAPKRPKSLPARVDVVRVKGEYYAVYIGFYEGKPYETFTNKVSKDFISEEGTITKKGKGVYSFISEHHTIDNLIETLSTEEKAATLYTSMLLRHGVLPKYIIKTARKVNDNITSFSSAMCRVLSKFVPTEVTGDLCPECGSPIINEGGCQHCSKCEWSKCMILYNYE